MRILFLLLCSTTLAHAQDVDRGRDLYAAKCLACHGESGKGDGPAARALTAPPPDMTTEAFWREMTDEKLRTTITAGKPSGVMRPFKMPQDKLRDLVAYLNTLKPAE